MGLQDFLSDTIYSIKSLFYPRIDSDDRNTIAFTIKERLESNEYKVIQGIFNKNTSEVIDSQVIGSHLVLYDYDEDIREIKNDLTVSDAVYKAVKQKIVKQQEYTIGNISDIKDSSVIQGSNTITINNYAFSFYLNINNKEEIGVFTTILNNYINQLNSIEGEFKRINTLNDIDNNTKIRFILDLKEKKEEVTHELANTLSKAGIDYNQLQKMLENYSN